MSSKRIGSWILTSLLAGSVSFALGCGGSEKIHKSHDHDRSDDGEEPVAGGGLPTEGTGGSDGNGGGHEGHDMDGDGDHEGHDTNGGDHEGHDMGGDPPTGEEILAMEMVAYEAAKPVFEDQCGTCHMPGKKPSKTRKKALKHLSMGSYPFGGHHAGELGKTIRKALGGDGEEATMPKDDPGSVQGEELKLILAWADAYEASHAAGAGHHEGHDMGGGHKH